MVVGVNSDSYNRGLGVVIEASPQIDEAHEHGDSYVYNGLGVHRNRNVIKFHPDMSGCPVRVEGPGGFANAEAGFTVPGWTNSRHQLNSLEITAGVNGTNTITLRAAGG